MDKRIKYKLKVKNPTWFKKGDKIREGKKWTEESRDKIRGPKNHQFNKTPWNKGKKLGYVPKMAFKKGNKIRLGKKHTDDTKSKMSLAKKGKSSWNYQGKKKLTRKSIKINGKSVLRSHVVWCSQPENLPYIPSGFVIHHIDLNSQNDKPDNLFLMKQTTHTTFHHDLFKELKNGI